MRFKRNYSRSRGRKRVEIKITSPARDKVSDSACRAIMDQAVNSVIE